MKKLMTAAALAALFAVPAFAAPQTYTIEPTHTFTRFSYNHLGLSTQLSRFDKTSGTVTLDAAAKTASVDVTVDIKSVNSGVEAFNGHLQGPNFLDAAKYPTATFKSTRVVFEGDKPSKIEGNLTIKDVTKPVTFTVTSFAAKEHPMMKKPVIGADATTTIKRSEFNAGAFTPAVGDEVTLTIGLEAVAQ